MRALIVGLLISAASVWLVARSIRSVVTGSTPRFFAPMRGTLWFSETPVRFVIHAGMWLFTSVAMMLFGFGFALDADPLVAIASPAGAGAAWAMFRVLRRRGSRSGDGGLGAFEALARGDREALAARVDALPEGGERTVLERVVRSWPEAASSPEGYREPRARRAGPHPDALDIAIAREQTALLLAVLPAVLGLVPAVVYVIHADAIRYVEAALITATVDTAIALGAVIAWRVARREHAAFAEAARAASRRLAG